MCEVIGGGTPSKDKAHSAFYSGDIPWATVRDMKSDLISDTEFKITKEAVKASSTNIIPKGNVVIATRVGLGKVCLIEHDTAINQDLRGVVPKDAGKLAVRFLFWWLKSVAQLIVKEGTGATVQGVKLPFIKSLPIPTPPLPEQQRIVAILDEAFEGIATATANAEKNLNNARELFKSYLQSVFTNKGAGWVEKKLEDLCEIKHGFAFDGNDFTTSTDILKPIVITPGNFTEYGTLSFTDKNTKRFSGVPPANFIFNQGDLVVVMTDLSSKMKILGRPALTEQDGVLHNQRIGRLVFNDNYLVTKFLYYFFLTQNYWDNIKRSATGTMVKHTAPKRILSNKLSFPNDLSEQQAIVAKLDELSTETKKLEAIYQQKLALLTELKKSLLQQAFSGALTH